MSEFLASLHFLRPYWFWALLLLPALGWLWRAREQRRNVWRDAVDPHLLPHLLVRGNKVVRGGVWLGALGFVIAVLALAGPSWRQSEQPLWQSHTPLVIALDLSESILAEDLPPSRLQQARAKIATLLRERTDGQVALVVYAGEPFTVAPLTDDAANVSLFLDALEPDVMPVDGQSADRAIEWSARLLRQAGFDSGDILLLTDRANPQATAAAAAAAAQGFRVSALGLGTAAGAPYRTRTGGIDRARLEPASLQALVAAGGGSYRALTVDDGDLEALGLLDREQAGAYSARGQKGLAWQDQGYWLLPLLMLLVLFAFRRGGAASRVLVLCLVLPLAMPAQAAEGGWWQRGDQAQHQRIEQGAAAYRQGDFAGAEQAFAGIDTATGRYNHGNALAKLGRYDEAIAAYDEALAHQPGMEDAIANRAAVEAARQRQQQEGGGQQNRQDQQNSQGRDPQNQDGQGQQQGDTGQDQKNPSSAGDEDRDQKQDGEPSPSPSDPQSGQSSDARGEQQEAEDAQAQQAADEAQRQRMQEAMEQSRANAGEAGEGDETRAAAQAETAEERERRQAHEAWLRRVPDEPGGLLKTKFRLEYERRQREGR